MRVSKPDSMAVLQRRIHDADGARLSLGLVAAFPLRAGAPAEPPELLDETALWALAQRGLGASAVLDMGLPKPAGELVARGAAYPPRRGADTVDVAIRVGPLRKALRVHGDRLLADDGTPRVIRPFRRMPIDPSTTYGGPDFAGNPAGKGHAPVLRDGARLWPAPNVEHADAPPFNPRRGAEPAGFWELPPDTVLHHAAPPDQRLDGYWRGDEAIEIENMHPRQSRLQAALPALRARCALRAVDSPDWQEVTAVGETVWLFPELEHGMVLYRACVAVDPDDPAELALDWEPLDAAPRPIDAVVAARQRPSRAPKAPKPASPAPSARPEAPRATPPTAAAAAPVAAAIAPEMPAELEQALAELERSNEALARSLGLTPEDVDALIPPEPEMPADPGELEAKLARELDALEAHTAAWLEQRGLTPEDLPPLPTAEPPPTFAEGLAALRALDAQVAEQMRVSGFDAPKMLALLEREYPQLAELAREALCSPPGEDAWAELERAAAACGVPGAAAAATEAALPPRPLTAPAVAELRRAGASLAHLDLSGLDLRGIDFAGADLTGAVLDDADLRGCSLRAANLRGARLRGARLAECDMREADLSRCSAARAQMGRAELRGARLEGGDFSGCDLGGAQLADALLAGTQFAGATLAAATASRCHAPRARFTDCELGGADFREAHLVGAAFDGSRAEGAEFTRADCRGAVLSRLNGRGACFVDADLTGSRADAMTCLATSRLTRARLRAACWEGSDLSGADLADADLDAARLVGVRGSGACLAGASAIGADWTGADLRQADLDCVNLFEGALRQARLDGARLQLANLYAADFTGAQMAGTCLDGANLDRAVMPRAAEASR